MLWETHDKIASQLGGFDDAETKRQVYAKHSDFQMFFWEKKIFMQPEFQDCIEKYQKAASYLIRSQPAVPLEIDAQRAAAFERLIQALKDAQKYLRDEYELPAKLFSGEDIAQMKQMGPQGSE